MELLSRWMLVLLLISPFLSACGGGSSAHNDSRLVGTWVSDRITGDQDPDTDQNTLTYMSDGTGQVFTPEGTIDILWEGSNGQITTTIEALGVTWTTIYELNASEDQGTFTTVVDGQTIVEDYHKVTQNYPEDLFGTWDCVSIVVNGTDGSCADISTLQLEAYGLGSVLWCVTDSAFVWRDPVTQVGGVVAYEVDGDTLILTEADDTGVTVTTYQR